MVVEAAGHPAALQTAIDLTAAGGRTITVGLPRPDARISVSPLGFVAEGQVADRQLPRLRGAVSRHSAFRRAVAVRAGYRWSRWCPRRIALDDINAAMDHLADGTAVRQLITF